MPDEQNKQSKQSKPDRKIVDTVMLSIRGRTIKFHLLAVQDEHGLSEGLQIDAPGEKPVTVWGFPFAPVVEAVGGHSRKVSTADDDYEDEPGDDHDLTSAQEIREKLVEHAMKSALESICQKIPQ